jgi:hypothetical protein
VLERHAWVDHTWRGPGSATSNSGNHFAAAMTFFTILTAVPLLMVAFAAASYVSGSPGAAGRPGAQHRGDGAGRTVESLNPIIETAIRPTQLRRDHRAPRRPVLGGVVTVEPARGGVAQWALPAPHPAALKRLPAQTCAFMPSPGRCRSVPSISRRSSAPITTSGPPVFTQEVVVRQGVTAGGLAAVLLAGLVIGAWFGGCGR